MLFNSFSFIFVFLPSVLLLFFWAARLRGHNLAVRILGAASIFFYGWWDPAFLPFLLLSIVVNYAVGRGLGSALTDTYRRGLVVFGILLNLSALFYFKYADFAVSNINQLTSWGWPMPRVTLPIGISFYTFTQIAYLVDASRRLANEYRFDHYLLFVTYFPHLIAGPILHHSEMMPQFQRPQTYRLSWENISVGLTMFTIGLFKKVVVADGIAAPYVAPVFLAAHMGGQPGFLESWAGALAYTFQLYFDFSGYSDMALGLSRMFNITLPLNFNSPYKAENIVEFWRRWHMTLSRFLRDYLYIPLGGNRLGVSRRYANLLATMVLGGLWHGANWTFVVWGALHGFYLIINHAWINLRRQWFEARAPTGRGRRFLGLLVGRSITFTAVVVGWTVFRSESIRDAMTLLKGMAGLNGFVLPWNWQGHLSRVPESILQMFIFGDTPGFTGGSEVVWLLVLLGMVWIAPNTQEILRRHRPALNWQPEDRVIAAFQKLVWQPTLIWLAIISVGAVISISRLSAVSEFLYFQF